MNIETGVREAKLLDPNDDRTDQESTKLSIVPSEEKDEAKQPQVDMSELKRVMKKMMEEGLGEAVAPNPEVLYISKELKIYLLKH